MDKPKDGSKRPWYQVLVYVEISLSFIVFAFLAQLIVYHMWLVYNGVSTFDHIIYMRELKIKKQEFQVSVLII